jgi:AcrR family transcriptional regulator
MAALDADRIAATALKIADIRGIEGFSMRAVADELHVTPMALYRYVKDKAALAALVVDSTIREHPLPQSMGDWQKDLLAIARWSRASTLAHPVVGHLRREFNVWTPSMLHMTERWLHLWQQSGLSLNNALLAATTSSMAITGLVHEEVMFKAMRKPDAGTLSFLPNVRALFAAKHDPEAQFTLAVQSLIEGLHARLVGKRAARRRGVATSTRGRRRFRKKP